jgi:hypothetical protein
MSPEKSYTAETNRLSFIVLAVFPDDDSVSRNQYLLTQRHGDHGAA